MRYVIDAYAWVEYFAGTALGEQVKSIVEDEENSIHTNIITIAELASHFSRHGKEFAQARRILLSLSSIYEPDQVFAEEAGILHAEVRKDRKHMGLADVFVLLTARRVQGKVVTGDQDFKGLKEAILLK